MHLINEQFYKIQTRTQVFSGKKGYSTKKQKKNP